MMVVQHSGPTSLCAPLKQSVALLKNVLASVVEAVKNPCRQV